MAAGSFVGSGAGGGLEMVLPPGRTSSEGGSVGPGGGSGGFDRETNVGGYWKLTLMNSAGVGEIGGGSGEMKFAPDGAGFEGGSVGSRNANRET